MMQISPSILGNNMTTTKQQIFQRGVEAGIFYGKFVELVSGSKFKTISGQTLKTVYDSTYENPNKIDHLKQKGMKNRLVCSLVVYNRDFIGNLKVLFAGSQEGMSEFVENKIKLREAEYAIVNR